MLITRIRWTAVRVPFRRPLVLGPTPSTHRYALLIIVTTDRGMTGLGEASPVGAGTEEEIRGLGHLLSSVAPRLLNVDVADALNLVLRVVPATSEGALLAFGLETALYDLLGKESGSPLVALLAPLVARIGAKPRRIKVDALIAVESPSEAARLAGEAVSGGFSTLKLKVGSPVPGRDEALVKAVRQAVGASVQVRVDANQAWSVEAAVKAIGRLQGFGLQYVEQPAPGAAGLAQVRERVNVPVAADESLTGPDAAQRLIAMGAADVFVVKGTRVGGLSRAKQTVDVALANGIEVVVTSSLETGVGVAASLHLAALASVEGPACGVATATLLEHDLLVAPVPVTAGAMQVPSEPGLGVELDMKAVQRYAIGVEGTVDSMG